MQKRLSRALMFIFIAIFFLGMIFFKRGAEISWQRSAASSIQTTAEYLNSHKDLIKEGQIIGNLELVLAENGREKDMVYTFQTKDGESLVLEPREPDMVSLFSSIKAEIALLALILIIGYYLLLNWLMNEAVKPVKAFSTTISKALKNVDTDMDDIEIEDKSLEPYLKDIENEIHAIDQSLNLYQENQRVRQEFTANVTHELKTPLTSINGYAEMISEGMVGEEDSKKFASIILEEGNRLLDLINETITLSHLDAGENDYQNYELIDLFQVAKRCVVNAKGLANDYKVQIYLSGQSTQIFADERMMMDIITNLISNAIKYNHPNGFVRVKVYPFKDERIISVEDNGIGISDENQDRIFERFYVVDRNKQNKKGTGLGLSLVKHMVRQHNGRIEMVSTLHKGSKFTVYLPNGLDIKERLERNQSPDDLINFYQLESEKDQEEDEEEDIKKENNSGKKKKKKKKK